MGIVIREPRRAQALPLGDLHRSAMRELAGGVSVITVGEEEHRTGLTATSVTSLSLEPPSLLVCVSRDSSTWSTLARYGAFAVNLLRARHAPVADRFSGRGGHKGPARYAEASWTTLVTGAPVLADALAAFDCEVEDRIERHSHGIIIGRVMAVHFGEEGGADPLIYWRGGYEGLGGR